MVGTRPGGGGYGGDPPLVDLQVGQRSAGLRVLEVAGEDGAVRVELEAPAGDVHELVLHGPRPARVEGAEIVAWTAARGRLRVTFPAGDAPFARATVRVRER